MKKYEGFTLVELMVTLAVMGIITMIAVPSFQSVIQASELKDGANKVLFILNDAKNNARLTREVSILKLDSSFTTPPKAKVFDVSSNIGKNVTVASIDTAVSFLASGLVETTTKKYPICITVTHSKSSKKEFISITQLGFIARSNTSCDTK